MKENTNLVRIDNDWGFTNPKEQMEEFEDVMEEADRMEKELQRMSNEEFAQFSLEMRIALMEEEERRFGDEAKRSGLD